MVLAGQYLYLGNKKGLVFARRKKKGCWGVSNVLFLHLNDSYTEIVMICQAAHHCFSTPSDFCSSGDIWQCLEELFIVTTGKGRSATGI